MGWHYAALEERFRRVAGIEGALAILNWDTAVVMPKKAAGLLPGECRDERADRWRGDDAHATSRPSRSTCGPSSSR